MKILIIKIQILLLLELLSVVKTIILHIGVFQLIRKSKWTI